eukprot:12245951-Alexandrium_andersonii.AAC.1
MLHAAPGTCRACMRVCVCARACVHVRASECACESACECACARLLDARAGVRTCLPAFAHGRPRACPNAHDGTPMQNACANAKARRATLHLAPHARSQQP